MRLGVAARCRNCCGRFACAGVDDSDRGHLCRPYSTRRLLGRHRRKAGCHRLAGCQIPNGRRCRQTGLSSYRFSHRVLASSNGGSGLLGLIVIGLSVVPLALVGNPIADIVGNLAWWGSVIVITVGLVQRRTGNRHARQQSRAFAVTGASTTASVASVSVSSTPRRSRFTNRHWQH